MGGVEGKGTLDEAGNGDGLLVWVQLDVGQSGVVIDDRVGVVLSNAGFRAHPAAGSLRPVAGNAMPRPLEARVAAGVHVQEIARTRPLIAVCRLP
jgi:hypothetical protein